MLNILIVDDEPHRFNFFDSHEFEKEKNLINIQMRNNIKDAIEFIDNNVCDLLIVDMAIPATAWSSEIKANGGIELLEYLGEDDSIRAPSFIIGLTASTDNNIDVSKYFEKSHWILLKIGTSGSDWHSRIRAAISHLISIENRESTIRYGVDVCIVTALLDPEQKAILNTDIDWSTDPEYLDSNTLIHKGFLTDKSGGKISIVLGCSLRMGSVEAALLSSKLIDRFRPRLLAMTGICAGLKSKVNLGDAILGHPVWDWTSSKWTTGDDDQLVVLPSPHYLHCEGEIISRFQQLKNDQIFFDSIRNKWQGSKPGTALAAHCGPIASGPIVVADGKTLENISTAQNRDVLGLEMEAYGVYCAAVNAGRPRPLSLSIKSVCDFADPRKNNDMQKYAAYTSAMVLHQFLYRFGRDICLFAKD